MVNLSKATKKIDNWLEGGSRVFSEGALRIVVGLLGVILPLWLIIYTKILADCNEILPSISDYFHSGANDIFVGILSAVCLSFLVFHGYDWKDLIVGKIAFVACLGIIIFPTNVSHIRTCHNCIYVDGTSGEKVEELSFATENKDAILAQLPYCPIEDQEGIWHYISAIIFFGCLVIFSLLLFPLSYKGVKWKDLPLKRRIRKGIYIGCGLGILGCMIAIFIISRNCDSHTALSQDNYVFWLETAMLSLFALSWLTKSRMFWKDEVVSPQRMPEMIAGD